MGAEAQRPLAISSSPAPCYPLVVSAPTAGPGLRLSEGRRVGGRQPTLSTLLILACPLFSQASAADNEARKVSGLAGAPDCSWACQPCPSMISSQPLCPDAFGLLQEETQGQWEEEEREAETHRLTPVSVLGGPGMTRRLSQRGAPTSRG